MRRSQPLRLLCYAVNGLGLGHLTRLIAICRQVRRLTTVLGVPTEILFLTSSEGEALCFQHHFAAFKIPSKTSAQSCQLDPHRFRKLAKQWVWNAINLISPDLLIVDTFPAGSFNELYDVLDLGSRNAFIYRAVRPEVALQPAFQAALQGYDRIIKPLEFGENPSPVPENAAHKVAEVGPILLRSLDETYDRAEARARLGLTDNRPAAYLSTGGGGDRDAEALFAQLVSVARQLPEWQFVVGAGLLYRGREFPAPNVTWTRRPVMIECFRAFDAALTAGGFNSVWELMHCGVPCLFLPRPRGHDDQENRTEQCVAAGAGLLLESATPSAIAAGLGQLRDQHAAFSAAARALLPRNHALDAAEELLRLVLPPDSLEEASGLIDSGVLFAATQAGGDEDTILKAAGTLWRRLPAAHRDLECADDTLAAAVSYLEAARAHPLPVGKALSALRKAEPHDTPAALAAQAQRLWEEPNDEV